MKNNVKLSLLSVFCLLCLILSGCARAQARQEKSIYIPPFVDEKEFDTQNHVKVLDELKSDYSIAYLNADDTKTLYLFSSPIAYQDNDEHIYFNNRIKAIESEILFKKGYNYTNSANDISTLFPDNINDIPIQILSKEFALKYSPCDTVKKAKYHATENSISYRYADGILNVNPTTLGVNNKIIGKKLSASYKFDFKIPKKFQIDDSVPEYILIKEDKDIKAILYKPILYAVNNAEETVFSYQTKITHKYESGKHFITYELDSQFMEQNKNSIITMSFNINCYRKKQPDSSVYSNQPTNNRYLSEYSFVGQDNMYGSCETNVRFENLSSTPMPLTDIVSVEYGINCKFFKKNSKISLNRVSENWCSLTTNWNNKVSYKETIDEVVILKNQVYYFNIIDLYIMWRNNINNEESEYNPRNGFILHSENKDSLSVFMSNDNAENVPFLKIVYK